MNNPTDGWAPEERDTIRELEPELEVLRRRHSADPPLELLQAARAGVLPDGLQSDADQYLASDAWAETLADDLAALPVALTAEDENRLLRRIRASQRETRRRTVPAWHLRPSFIAATLALLVVASATVSYVNRATPPQTPATVTTGPTTPQQVTTFALQLEKPAIRLSVAALTWRGAGDNSSLMDQLRPGLDAFRADDYASADEQLGRAAAAFPKAVEPVYYQGISRLFLNDPRGAIDSLSAAARLADASFRPDVTWYLAVAEERVGMITEARVHVQSVCQSASDRSAQACAALAKMP